jgi:xylulokinase
MEEIGLTVKEVTAAGGGTKNLLWMQIVADITGKPLRIPEITIGGSYGSALLAAMGIGQLKNFDELAAVIRFTDVILPNPENHRMYQKRQQIYDGLYIATRDLMHQG